LAVSLDEVRSIFTKWCDDQQELYAVVVEHGGIQTISGSVTGVKDGIATLTDKVVEVRLPIGKPMDASITKHGGEIRSVTMSWEDMSVFVVARM